MSEIDRLSAIEHCITFPEGDRFILLYSVEEPGEVEQGHRASARAYLAEHEDSRIGQYAQVHAGGGTNVQPVTYWQRFICEAKRDMRLADIYDLAPGTFEAADVTWTLEAVWRPIVNEFQEW